MFTFEHGYLNCRKVGFTDDEVESWQVYGVKTSENYRVRKA